MNQPRMNHDDWQELAVGFAFHALEPDEERELLAHLATCDDCTQLVAETHEVTSVLSDDPYGFDQPGAVDLTSDDLEAELAGSGLRDRIVAAAEADPRAQAVDPPTRRADRRPFAPSQGSPVVSARSPEPGDGARRLPWRRHARFASPGQPGADPQPRRHRRRGRRPSLSPLPYR